MGENRDTRRETCPIATLSFWSITVPQFLGKKLIKYIGGFIPEYTASYLRRQNYESSPTLLIREWFSRVT